MGDISGFNTNGVYVEGSIVGGSGGTGISVDEISSVYNGVSVNSITAENTGVSVDDSIIADVGVYANTIVGNT